MTQTDLLLALLLFIGCIQTAILTYIALWLRAEVVEEETEAYLV